ncbi:unnamed protein product [Trichogramma brassicae]|uniref:Uncharacterized protein n=1 Tax=Trichogramma brassicae TaxID=86971 RepID=A0A6H5J0R5_9HYME|nr:unnamed protein product [Trichogramma brassicae]
MPAMCDHAVDGSEKGDTTIDDEGGLPRMVNNPRLRCDGERQGACPPDGPEVRTHKTEPDGEKPDPQDGARQRVPHSQGVAGSENDTHKMALTSGTQDKILSFTTK